MVEVLAHVVALLEQRASFERDAADDETSRLATGMGIDRCDDLVGQHDSSSGSVGCGSFDSDDTVQQYDDDDGYVDRGRGNGGDHRVDVVLDVVEQLHR